MYNNVPTTCLGRFLTRHHQVGIQCQRNYIPTINLVISVSLSTEKGGSGRDLSIQYSSFDRAYNLLPRSGSDSDLQQRKVVRHDRIQLLHHTHNFTVDFFCTTHTPDAIQNALRLTQHRQTGNK
jgi:hypothetical protein